MSDQEKPLFERLYGLNVNDHVEKKQNLSYLSWAWAWSEFKKAVPDATYKVWKCPDTNRPYVYDDNTGYMVFTEITAEGETHEMWLFVMDGANKAMKAEPYTYTVGRGNNATEKTCNAASMFDINTTIMRCLVKNMGMFGLGLYIYAGEDVPPAESEKEQASRDAQNKLQKTKAAWYEPLLAFDVIALQEAFEASGYVSECDDHEEMLRDLIKQVDTLEKLTSIKNLAKKKNDEIGK